MKNLKSLTIYLALFLTTIFNCFSQSKTITTSKRGYATQTGWEHITSDMKVGHDHNVIVNDVSHRAFAWFDIPSDIKDGVITSATLTVNVKDLSQWNEWLDYIHLHTVDQTWYTFRNSYDFGTGVYKWQYNELSGDDFVDSEGKSGTLVFSINPDFLKNKIEQGFAFTASPETPSDFWGKKTNYIILNNPTLTIEYTQVTLSSITISGPTTVNENSSASYTCTANYSDGSTQNVTSSASWSDNSSYAAISTSGVLLTQSVSSDKSCTITASYEGKSDTHNVTIKDIPPTFNISNAFWGTEVDEDADGYTQARRLYFDINVSSGTHSIYAKIYVKESSESSGSLYSTTGNFQVSSNGTTRQNVIIGLPNTELSHNVYDFWIYIYFEGDASTLDLLRWDEDGDLFQEKFETASQDNPVTLSSITISGATSINENSSASYTCSANYSDGSTQDVQ